MSGGKWVEKMLKDFGISKERVRRMRKVHGVEYVYFKRKMEDEVHKLSVGRRVRGRARLHAANAASKPEKGRWLMDTGSGFDLMSKKKLSEDN